MDNLVFINTDTWEIVDEPEALIHVDKDIAEAIAILNKKGYKTKSSCSGHADRSLRQYFDKKENLKKYHNVTQEEYIKEYDKVVFFALQKETDTYIMFDKIYNFDKLPKGFKYEARKIVDNISYDENGKKVAELLGEKIDDCESCTIRKYTNLISKDGKMYNYRVIDNKLKKTNKELLEWAKELKDNK